MGLGQEVAFTAVGSNGCSQCEYRVSTTSSVDVCEVLIDRPDFIGLDRTDVGRANPTIYSASANLDPKPSAAISYDWRDCGICSFTGCTDQARVRYFAPDSDHASASFLAEPLTVAVGVGDSVAANCTTNFTVVKVKMVTPSGDPVSRPVSSGLGQNEFTYSDGSPGVLSMNLVAEIEPDEVAELFFSEFRFVVDSIDGSEQTWAAANPDGAAVAGFGMLLATASFRNMPAHNSAFGKKKAALLFRGAKCDESDYEVFFPKSARNHPACSTCANCPNWFYYWREGKVCSIPSDAKYEQRAGLYGFWSQAKGLVLSDKAAESDVVLELTAHIIVTNRSYGVSARVSDSADVKSCSAGVPGVAYFAEERDLDVDDRGTWSLSVGGDGRGIKCVAMTVKHELGHKNLSESMERNQSLVDQSQDAFESAQEMYGTESIEAACARRTLLERLHTLGDCDNGNGDGVSDSDERMGVGGVWSNDYMQDTFSLSTIISGDYSSYGDEEARMRRLERDVGPECYHEDLDWANPGCQSKVKCGP